MSDGPLVGVIGGVGPQATAYFLDMVVRLTDAARDQDLSGWRAPGRINRFLRHLAAEASLPLADIEAALETRSRAGLLDKTFFLDSIHLNPEGHAVAAEVLGTTIVEAGLLPGP